MVTVALRRVNVMEPGAPRLVDFIDPKKYVYLPNTAANAWLPPGRVRNMTGQAGSVRSEQRLLGRQHSMERASMRFN
jgi:hypothetical protein